MTKPNKPKPREKIQEVLDLADQKKEDIQQMADKMKAQVNEWVIIKIKEIYEKY